ncbi:hypothetical protein [Leucobacter chromiiresistens]|uniref:Uncharacterized protein n=1 Tax=Leucobacter chromiiresistens TaxID=1079994 RepID=A0A1H0XPC1_9MICO|nr:hypothetical protein [Leucobacter chromiiresistens]SDQ04760.1 hypothetical protein SAMN04488565_0003 [Leucobacter chromiiresistens]SDQ05206.1 hypothetical protein SAMN04488565_0057 [Leucobacter chromiiresistens]
MATGVRIKLNKKGIIRLLQSQQVADHLKERGERIADAAGPGFEATPQLNKDRAVVFVRAETTEARRAQAADNALQRAIDAGR